MKLNELIKTKSLESWINKFGWQGGTIHQVEKELHNRLIGKCDYNEESKEYSAVLIDNNKIMFL